MKRINLILSLVLSVILASCDEGKGQFGGDNPQGGEVLMSFSATGEPVTKVSIDSEGVTALENGDRALVYVPGTGVSAYYVYSAETGLFTPDSEPIQIGSEQAYICCPADCFTAPAAAGGSVTFALGATATSTVAGHYGYPNPMAAVLESGSVSGGTASVLLKNLGSILRVNLTGADDKSGTVSSVTLTAQTSICGTSTLSWNSGTPALSAFDGAMTVTADCGEYDVPLSAVPASFSFFLPAGVSTDLDFSINNPAGENINFYRGEPLATSRATLYDVNKSVSFFKEIVAAEQSKYYMTAQEDLMYKVTPKTAGMNVQLLDSKFFAFGERVLSVKYVAGSGAISGIKAGDKVIESGSTVTMTWASADPVERPAVGKADNPGEFGIHCFPGTYAGKFVVTTNRYTYEFTKSITLAAGQITAVTLDFATPDVQPTRKVGVIGDSISTFDGQLCNREFAIYYPKADCDVTLEKTWWWRIINEKMSCGVLDVNNSWSGSKVIHEFKNGRYNKKPMEAGFVDRAYEFVDPDIVLIHGGTNDSNNDSPIGDYIWNLPVGQNDITTYRGAYIELIKKIQSRYEGVQIIIIVGDHLLTDYAESTIAIAEHFNLPYVDFATAANADGALGDPANIEKYSGSHPTAAGFTYMVNKIYETCKDYLP